MTFSPAAADTIMQHFKDTGTSPEDYDMILTGDLGALGSRIVKDLTWEKGYDISEKHVDCGEIVYKVIENEFQGGSGAGCSAVVLNSYVLSRCARDCTSVYCLPQPARCCPRYRRGRVKAYRA